MGRVAAVEGEGTRCLGMEGASDLPVAAAQSQRGALWPLPGSDSLNLRLAMVQEALGRGWKAVLLCVPPLKLLEHTQL